MQNYRHFKPEELSIDPSFQRWRLVNDPVDGEFWNDWLRQNPDKEELVERAAHLLTTLNRAYEQRLGNDVPLSDREIRAEIHRLHQAIQEPYSNRVKWFSFTPVRYGIAASLLVLLGLFGWYTLPPTRSKQAVTYQASVATAANPLLEVVNTSRKLLPIKLPDGSAVGLYPNSRMSYDERTSGVERAVYLLGKASFNVVKNPSKPFYVYANNLVTTVIGTRFTVQAYEGTELVRVVVRTGKVSVSVPNRGGTSNHQETSPSARIVLTPNQQVVFSPIQTRLVKSVVEQPVLLSQTTKKQTFTFKRTPIADVFSVLAQSYGITIAFDKAVMRNCYLTASLPGESLFGKLDLICRTLNASYEQADGSVIISSKGCND